MRSVSSYLIIITAALSVMCFDSCRRHKNEQGDAIYMGISDNGTRTKAAVNAKADLITQAVNSSTGFGVFGYKTVNSTAQRLFDNVEVTPSDDVANPDWTYSPIRYWDKNPDASYQFIAYWPHLGTTSGVNAYVSEENKVLTINNIPYWQDASLDASADFMTDEKVGIYSDFTEQGVTKVRFTFGHILAKLVIKAYYVGVRQNTVGISGIRLTTGSAVGNKILSPTGKATYTQPYGGAQGTVGFTNNTPDCTTTHTLFAPNNPLVLPTEAFDDETDQEDPDYEEICAWLMVPCTGWTNLGFSIDYAIAGSQNYITTRVNGLTLNTTVGDQVQNGQTFSGKSYIVTLKFDSSGGGVDLQSVLVRDWVSQNVETNVYNW